MMDSSQTKCDTGIDTDACESHPSLWERVRAARGEMYSVVRGEGLEAMIVKDGIVQGVVAVPDEEPTS